MSRLRRALLVLLLAAGLAGGDGALARSRHHHPPARPDAAEMARLSARVDRAIADGSVFDRERLRPEALTVLDAYRRGDAAAGGSEARLLAPRLDGRTVRQFKLLVEALARQERAVHSEQVTRGFANAVQTMDVWEFRDGTVVRYKPKGDSRRNYPTFSLEVKDARRLPNSEAKQDAIAFKVDPAGRPVPSTPRQVAVPPDVPRAEVDDWIDIVMEAGHRPLKLW